MSLYFKKILTSVVATINWKQPYRVRLAALTSCQIIILICNPAGTAFVKRIQCPQNRPGKLLLAVLFEQQKGLGKIQSFYPETIYVFILRRLLCVGSIRVFQYVCRSTRNSTRFPQHEAGHSSFVFVPYSRLGRLCVCVCMYVCVPTLSLFLSLCLHTLSSGFLSSPRILSVCWFFPVFRH